VAARGPLKAEPSRRFVGANGGSIPCSPANSFLRIAALLVLPIFARRVFHRKKKNKSAQVKTFIATATKLE
jgi:hypothetical protein